MPWRLLGSAARVFYRSDGFTFGEKVAPDCEITRARDGLGDASISVVPRRSLAARDTTDTDARP